MKDNSRWSRRKFVQMAGYSSVGAMTLRLPTLMNSTRGSKTPRRLAYVGFVGDANGEGIAVFNATSARWRQTSTIPSRMPSSLVLDAKERFLYAVNEIAEHEGLPTGTVEAYAIDAADGSLTLLNRQRLSLSATSPRHAAVSPDGRALVVAVHGGGAYNVLPLKKDGSLGEVAGILKETGAGPRPDQTSAHPQRVIFDRTGRVMSTDLGSDRLSVLELDSTGIRVARRYAVGAGEGPRQVTIHPNGQLLFVANGLEASVVSYGYDPVAGRITERLAQVATKRGGNAVGLAMAMDPEGQFLYTSHESPSEGISVWKIAEATGRLERLQVKDDEEFQLHEISVTSDGKRLLGLSRRRGGIFGWNLANGRLGEAERLATLTAPISIAVKSL